MHACLMQIFLREQPNYLKVVGNIVTSMLVKDQPQIHAAPMKITKPAQSCHHVALTQFLKRVNAACTPTRITASQNKQSKKNNFLAIQGSLIALA